MTRWFFLKMRLPGTNEVLDWRRTLLKVKRSSSRPDVYSIRKKSIESSIELFAGAQGMRRPLDAPAWETIVFFEPTRDFDNQTFGAKFVNDALKRLGTLPDDDQEWVRGLTVHVLHRAAPGVLVAFSERSLTLEEALGLLEGNDTNGKRNEGKEETRSLPGRAGDDSLPAPAGGTRPRDPRARRKAGLR